MADSGTVRQQRYRKHRAGDHSLCRPEHCPGAGPAVRAGLAVRAAELEQIDPRAELLRLVRRLIAASEAAPQNTALAAELRRALAALPSPPGELDPVERIRAEVAARQAARRAGVLVDVPVPALGIANGRVLAGRWPPVRDVPGSGDDE